MASKVFIKRVASTKTIAFLGVFLLLVLLIAYSSCGSSSETDFSYSNHADNVAYVGMETCASCHGDKHSTFIHTGMGLSFDKATRMKSSALFGTQHIVYDSILNMYYKPFWESDKLFIKEYRLQGEDTIHQQNVEINYVVGSGQHTNSHLFNRNGYIYQAPITFYVQDQKWDLAPGFENGNNSRFDRILNSECISCHNSMPKLVDNSDFKFETIGKGIDCERCHGPGALHVKERLAGIGVDVTKEIDPTIVNPRKLSWERQIDLCQRCHLQGLNVLKKGKKFTDFKPGMVLSDIFEIYLPEYEGENNTFDMANHSQRFQMSQCFIQGNKEALDFTCISCHNPHISVTITGIEVYNSACKNCHQEKKCTEETSVLLAAKNNCVECHMPSSGSEDIPHVSVHDHFIRVPKPQKEVQERQRLVGLYAVNNASPEVRYEILAHLEYWEKFDKNPFYLNKAKKLLEGTNFNELWLKYFYLKEEYDKAISLDLDEKGLSPWEQFMLGESYARQKQMSQAFYYLEKSYNTDPTNRMIASQLLTYYIQVSELEKAQMLLNALLLEFPLDGKILNAAAQLNIMKGDLAKGKDYMRKAFQASPDNVQVWITHFNYFLRTKSKKEVLFWGSKILKVKPDFLNRKQFNQILDDMM
ncbi:MAG: hypothetical protein COA58_07080 [Bacteroidetes bacterium]|nr:MAG: hypothetical protein COA58_07080 [Bacteroidota bacterium]